MAFQLHLKIRQAVERSKIKRNSILLIGTLFYVYTSNFAHTQFSNEYWHNPFIMNGVERSGNIIVQDIYKPAYIDYASKALSWVVFIAVLCFILPEYREILFISGFLFLGYLFEFGLIYNNPASWVHIPLDFIYEGCEMPIPLGISTVVGVVFFIMLVLKLIEK